MGRGTGTRVGACGLAAAVLLGLATEAGAAIPASERAALIALYESTNGAGWTNRTGWRNGDDTGFADPGTECSWYGVTCSGDNVQWLSLAGNGLDGPVPAALGSLPALQFLLLNDNGLTGPIPPELATATSLEVLSLFTNRLEGPIPTPLATLSSLRSLLLSGNGLTGGIPPQLGQLGELDTLWLDGNPLGGTIPKELGALAKLTQLGLSGCELTGTIPPELAGLTSLSRLDARNNQLEGELPGWVWSLTGLSTLALGSNQLTGTIPAALGNLTQLFELDLSLNQLTGTIPPQIGTLSQLTYLRLGQNQLTGTIPAGLGSLANLVILSLGGNQLTGSIPDTFANPDLWLLDLDDNALSGSVPASIGTLPSLRFLYLSRNQLGGGIPSSLGGAPALYFADLGENQLEGEIPSALGGAAQLAWLRLDRNRLSGPIPASLGSLPAIRWLYLADNRLSGAIPAALGSATTLSSLGLRSNALSGPVPPELAGLTGLVDGAGLDLRWNALHTDDPALAAFLEQKQSGGGWQSTQTVAPTGVVAGAAGTGSVLLSWTPIAYSGDGGGYRVRYGTTAGGPYPGVFGPTAGKLAGSAVVSGLVPGTLHHFVVETVTDPHLFNQSTLVSEASAPVAATTASGPSASYVLAVTKDGAGSGRVTSSPAGIDCGPTCGASFVGDTAITLTAAAAQGSVFAGWGGACSGAAPTCDLAFEADAAVTATFTPPPPTSYYTVEPCRAWDSRVPGLGGPLPLEAGSETNVTLAGACGISPGARAVSFNVTVTQPTAQGHLRLYPQGAPRPNAASLNYVPGLNRGNNAIIPLGPAGELTVYVNQAGGTVHVVIDVNGYYE